MVIHFTNEHWTSCLTHNCDISFMKTLSTLLKKGTMKRLIIFKNYDMEWMKRSILSDTYILDLMLLLLFYYETCLIENLSVLFIKAGTLHHYIILIRILHRKEIFTMPRDITSFKETETLLNTETKQFIVKEGTIMCWKQTGT